MGVSNNFRKSSVNYQNDPSGWPVLTLGKRHTIFLLKKQYLAYQEREEREAKSQHDFIQPGTG